MTRAQHISRLVEEKSVPGLDGHRTAIHFDHGGIRIDTDALRAHLFSVNAHPTVANQLLAGAP
jgi:hypothetical protein